MSRKKQKLSKQFLAKVEQCAYERISYTDTAIRLGISRRWLFELRKRQSFQQAWQSGRDRAARDYFGEESAAELDRLEREAKALHVDSDTIKPKEGYVIKVTREELPGGGYREVITQKPKPLPTFEELKKDAIKRRKGKRKGLYDF
jgi:hypothetical protein